MDYGKHVSTVTTPQTEPIPGRTDQVQNYAGGYVFAVDKWKALERFLILGTEGGTYYCGEKELTVKACASAVECIKEDGPRAVKLIADISDAGKAKSNDQALFILAMAAKTGDLKTREEANKALPRVARIGTHLFHYAKFIKNFGGWGEGQKRSIGRWYSKMDPKRLAFQAVKYQQRDGWSHRDLLRLCHVKPETAVQQIIYSWIVKGLTKDLPESSGIFPPEVGVIWAFERAKQLGVQKDVKGIVQLIGDYNLPHECVPNEVKDRPEVWEALLQHMRPEAMVRNLGKLTSIGMLGGGSASLRQVKSVLLDESGLLKARLHPLTVLVALATYRQGHGVKGGLTWSPIGQVCDTLDEAFYLSFGAVEPIGKFVCLAVDVSGSMDWSSISGMPLTPRQVAAAMAMVTARVEKEYEVVGFSTTLKTLAITPKMRLDDVCEYMAKVPMGGTDCGLPVREALANKVKCECFVSYTDSETWAGPEHVSQVLKRYRQKMSIPAKLVTVGMTATEFTIADPKDAGMLDVCGCGTDMPNVISNFLRG